jgi:PAS domain S-box-containing protein
MVVGLDRDGRVVLCNQAAELVSGYPRSELLGANWF